MNGEPVVRRARRGRLIASLFAGVLILAALACVLLPPYRSVSPSDQSWPVERLARDLDPWILADGFSERLTVEVDWIAGCRPGPLALEGLRRILDEYGPRGRPNEVLLDEEIPKEEWTAALSYGDAAVDRVVERHANPALYADPEGRSERRYVLFVPSASGRKLFGYSSTWKVPHGDERVPVAGVVVFHDTNAAWAMLWLTPDRVERMTLIHEFGHQLGLVTNRTHERLHPHTEHCTQLQCLMAHPTPRVLLRNVFAGLIGRFPDDYCELCRSDIRAAQEAWRQRLRDGAAYRQDRVAERLAARMSYRLADRIYKGQATEALQEIESLPDAVRKQPRIESIEAGALVGLGRLDEAQTIVRGMFSRTTPEHPLARGEWDGAWSVGHALNRKGRCEEALAMFTPGTLEQAEDYEYQQGTFVALEALHELRRYRQAADRMDLMLRKVVPISFTAEEARARRATLLLKAGAVSDAESAARAGLGSGKTRKEWLAVGVQIADRSGRPEEARELRKELVETFTARLDHEEHPQARAALFSSIALAQAELGESDAARKSLAELDRSLGGAWSSGWVFSLREPVLARLGEWKQIAAMVRSEESGEPPLICGCEELDPMRADAVTADLFAHCPALALARGGSGEKGIR